MKTKSIPLIFALIVVIGAVFMSFAGKGDVSLRLHLEKGKTYSYKTKTTQVMTMDLQGQFMSTTQNIEMKNTISVLDIVDGQFLTELKMDNIKFNQTVMGMTMNYDSEHPENTSPMLQGQVKQFEDQMKQPHSVTFDARGNITNKEAVSSQDAASFITALPEEAVHVGSTWTQDASIDVSGISSSNHATYTVTKISKKEVHADFTSTVTATGNAELNGTNSGTVVFDIATGMAKSHTFKSDISLTINEQGMSIPASLKGTTTITLE